MLTKNEFKPGGMLSDALSDRSYLSLINAINRYLVYSP